MLNSNLSHLQCSLCKKQFALDKPMNLCPDDNRPLLMVYDIESIRKHKKWYHPNTKSLWRFSGLLPVSDNYMDFGEGFTPLLEYHDHKVANKHGFKLYIKDEGKGHYGFGQNPTLSFKDRGMTIVTNMAKHYRLDKLVVPTQGNAGDSLAYYANKMGIKATIIMPDDTPKPIQGNVAALSFLNPSIKLDLVQGTIKEAGEKMKAKYIPAGYFNVATFQEPGWRIEGKKTMGLELAEPNILSDKWQLPDVILYPTGGGTGILGMWKAFDELEQLGMIGIKRPKIIAVQSKATQPITTAFYKNNFEPLPAHAGSTLAIGLNVAGGVGHFKVLEIIRKSGGVSIAINEKKIAKHLSKIWEQKHWWICPEAAACMAALKPLSKQGIIMKNDQVVVFNTGSFEKYLPDVRHLL